MYLSGGKGRRIGRGEYEEENELIKGDGMGIMGRVMGGIWEDTRESLH